MKILAPINKVEEVDKVIEAGAGEIYCGVVAKEWEEEYTTAESINREPKSLASLPSYRDLKKAVNIAHSYGVPVFLTLNATYYSQEQYPLIKSSIKRAIDSGIDAFIVSDLGLLLFLRESGLKVKIHISKLGTTFNVETAKFYRELGATRIILPEHWKIAEMERLVHNIEQLEVEIFALNGGCKYIEGFCTFLHSRGLYKRTPILFGKTSFFNEYLFDLMRKFPEKIRTFLENTSLVASFFPGVCKRKCKVLVKAENSYSQSQLRIDTKMFSTNFIFHQCLCAACNIYEFRKMGITSLKIMGRLMSSKKKVRDVRFLNKILSYSKKGNLSQEQFSHFVKEEYKRIYHVACGETCYYS